MFYIMSIFKIVVVLYKIITQFQGEGRSKGKIGRYLHS